MQCGDNNIEVDKLRLLPALFPVHASASGTCLASAACALSSNSPFESRSWRSNLPGSPLLVSAVFFFYHTLPGSSSWSSGVSGCLKKRCWKSSLSVCSLLTVQAVHHPPNTASAVGSRGQETQSARARDYLPRAKQRVDFSTASSA